MSRIKRVRNKLESIPAQLNRFRPLALLVIRLTLAAAFLPAGWAKLGSIDQTAAFFTSIGIPLAGVLAPLVGFFELTAGVLVLVGLAARYAAIGLTFLMIAVVRLAKWDEVSGATSLVDQSEFLYGVLSFALLTMGSGAWSLDARLSTNRKERDLA